MPLDGTLLPCRRVPSLSRAVTRACQPGGALCSSLPPLLGPERVGRAHLHPPVNTATLGPALLSVQPPWGTQLLWGEAGIPSSGRCPRSARGSGCGTACSSPVPLGRVEKRNRIFPYGRRYFCLKRLDQKRGRLIHGSNQSLLTSYCGASPTQKNAGLAVPFQSCDLCNEACVVEASRSRADRELPLTLCLFSGWRADADVMARAGAATLTMK